MKVLVIDDEIDICHLVQMALKVKGHDVRYATSGDAGISNFQSFSPDIVFLDMTLPDKSGIDVARSIKDTEHGRAIPVVLMTGRPPELNSTDAAMFATVLIKPFSITSLEPLVKKLTGKP